MVKKISTIGVVIIICTLLLTACNPPHSTSLIPATSTTTTEVSTSTSKPEVAEPTPVEVVELPPDEYLAARSIPISELASHPEEEIGLGRFDIVLMGEFHANKKTNEAELEIIEYLLETQSTRHLILEYGYFTTYLLNLYLQTGDESIIDQMEQMEAEKEYNGFGLPNRDTYDFYRSLYAISDSSTNGPILVYPGDYSSSLDNALLAMNYLLPETPPPPEIEKSIDQIRSYNKDFFDPPANWYSQVISQQDAYEEYLGANWDTFFAGLTAENDQTVWFMNGWDDAVREQYMIELALDAIAQAPNEKWLGRYGIYHVRMDEIALDTIDQPTIGNHLANEAVETMGRVGVIALAYYESILLGDEAAPEEYPIISEIAPSLPDDITLCRLDLPGSPFDASTDISLQAQQYLLTIRYSESATPFS